MADRRGARLVAAMEARQISKLSVLAAELRVSESAVSRWRNNGPMTVENVKGVCRALDISADWYLLARGHMDLHRNREDAPTSGLQTLVHRLSPLAQHHFVDFLRALGH